MKYVPLVALLYWLLAGCAWLQPALPTLTPPLPDEAAAARQQWQLSYKGQDYRFQVVVESGPEVLRLLVMDSFGRRLASLHYDGQRLDIERSRRHPVQALWPHLLQAVQLSYWSPELLRRASEPNWRIEDTPGLRRVYFSGILWADIEYAGEVPWGGAVGLPAGAGTL